MRSTTEPARGSPPVEALAAYLDRWATLHLSCEPADRSTAEEGVRLAYTAAGLPPPERIVWCGGPLEIAERLASVSSTDTVGSNVKAEIFDRVRARVGTLAEIFWNDVLAAAARQRGRSPVSTAFSRHDRCKELSGAVHRAVLGAADWYLWGLRIRARHALLRWRGLPRLLPRSGFDEIALGPHDLVSLGTYEYLHEVLAWQEPTEPLLGLWRIAKSAGWIVPHAHVCWISERPSRLCADNKGRLHSAVGPALSYRDGWSVYGWKGVEVPDWIIEHPERITADTVADAVDPVLRNCMIEIMTPERFIETGVVARVSADKTGMLWRKRWSCRGVTIASWAAVEVRDGTVAVDGSPKRHFLRVPASMNSAREAVAWTYGLSPEEYARLELRT